MEMKWIEAFVMVAETGSFSAAAEAMYLSQSTVSFRIRRLEQELDTILFVRNGGKRANLTPKGRKLYPHYKEAIRAVRLGNQALAGTRDTLERLRLACPNHIGDRLLSSLLLALYDAFPELECEVGASTTDQILEDIRNGTTDAGLLFLHMNASNGDYTAQPVAMEKSIIAASPNHPLYGRKHLHIQDLKNERFLILTKASHKFPIMDKFLHQHGLSTYHLTEINNMEWIKMLLRNNHGIALLQQSTVEQELANGTLVELSVTEQLPHTPLSFIYRNEVPQNVAEFILNTLKRSINGIENSPKA